MRVIAGSAGGIQLEVPKQGVRPTMDRVKAAIFSSLADRVIEARVLDLFAGTGALGIEALSRGAASVLFVEQDRQSVRTIEKNLARTKMQGRTRQEDVFEFLAHPPAADRFHIILADPPYEQTRTGERYTEKLLTNESLAGLLEPDGVFVLEKRPSERLPEASLWEIARRKTYGATEVLFLCVASPARADPKSEIPARNASPSDAGG
ncbi:MAG TPA: 16S rRNA (guanine(966)-N(2))-methyltransferase RsmD [Chthoniobacterales bacterium]|jgi:16S rRNA (guanine966-N2)-methyltransferase